MNTLISHIGEYSWKSFSINELKKELDLKASERDIKYMLEDFVRTGDVVKTQGRYSIA